VRPCLLLLLLPLACKARIQPERESELYAGVGFSGLPSVGGSLTAGQYFSRQNPRSDFAFEMRASYQAGEDSATQDGKFAQIQAGVKQVTAPGHPRGWVFRYGFTWMRITGDPKFLDVTGDYFGVYGGVGYQWYLGPRWSICPEISANVVNGEATVGWDFLPQVGISLYFDF